MRVLYPGRIGIWSVNFLGGVLVRFWIIAILILIGAPSCSRLRFVPVLRMGAVGFQRCYFTTARKCASYGCDDCLPGFLEKGKCVSLILSVLSSVLERKKTLRRGKSVECARVPSCVTQGSLEGFDRLHICSCFISYQNWVHLPVMCTLGIILFDTKIEGKCKPI